jgi:glycosyltransferase involved in cell wall biosynthesis
MKIGIIGLGFVPGGTGGTETYFRNLLEGLQLYDAKNKYILIVKKEYLREAKKMVKSKRWKVVGVNDVPNLIYRGVRRVKLAKLSNNDYLVKKINDLNLDLVHFPMQTIYPYGLNSKKVLTFMDMQDKYFPEFFSRNELEFRRNNYMRSVLEADTVICISEYTRTDIIRYYGNKFKDKTNVIYLAGSKDKIYKKNITIELSMGHYFYYPAATWPHKNHERLIRAFAEVSRKYPDYRLVLTGLKRQSNNKVIELIKKLDIIDKVEIKGYLTYFEVESVFKGAFALVFPSLFEGFGLPVLEAMSMGVPVVSSNSSSLPEVGGDAVLYFDPLDTKDIEKKMINLIEDPALQKKLIRKGRKQSNKFTLKNMIKETIEVYNETYYEK